jgi:ubiquinone/menaquinone biosynthesis C-methylase UbiE
MPGDKLKNSIPDDEVMRVATWYDSISKSYDELYAAEQQAKFSKIFNKAIIAQDCSILDIGCGTGEFAIRAINEGIKVKYYVGIDISSRLAEIAKKKINCIRNLVSDIIVADLSYPPLREGAPFEAIIMISVLRKVYDVSTIVDHYIEKYVKKDGLLIYSVISDEVMEPNDEHLITSLGRNEILYVIHKELR